MATPFDSISLKIASPEEIKELAKRTCCKRRSSTVGHGEPFICPEMHTCNCGEVKKAETINYRSFRPELEGLFCEAIFGPSKDWECNCGKYKRIKHKGVICDRCGVEVTRQHVRRERMGYIQLASPVSHIWFFKGVPSRIGAFCELSARQIENILYFDAFMVTEADEELQEQGIMKPNQLISEAEFDRYKREYRGRFKAGAGGQILAKRLASLDLEAECAKIVKELEETRSHQKKVKLTKQLRLMEDFISSGQRPEWMILDVLPVIPPDLRPLVTLDGGRFATSDLNDLYRRLIHRNNRLAKLIKMRSPEVILRNEKRMLQEAVDAFFDNGRHGRRVTGPGNRELKSLSHVLKGKVGRFRQNLLGKRVDYSGRSVIVVGPELGIHQCGIPKQMAVELFKPFIIERLQAHGYSGTIKRAKAYVEHIDSNSPVWEVLEEVIEEHPVLLNRPPTLHRLGIQAFMPVLVEGKSIRIPPLVCKAFNADFDGDQMAVHVPLTAEAQAEAKLLMLSSHNILKPSHGGPIAVPELDMVLGPSYLTKTLPEHDADAQLLHKVYTTRNGDATLLDEIRRKPWYHRRYAHMEEVIAAHGAGQLKLHDSVQLFFPENGGPREPILTTVGRVIFNEVLPAELKWVDAHSGQRLPFFNGEAGGRQLSAIVETCFNTPELGTRGTVALLEKLQKLAFEYATLSGISPGIIDYITPSQREGLLAKTEAAIAKLRAAAAADADTEELENQQIHLWYQALREMENIMFSRLPELETQLVERGEDVKGFSPVHIMADSGARARKNPFMQISAVIGLKAKQSGEILLPPITTSYRDGLDVIDYFNSTYGSRKGLVDTAMKTAASGYLTRKLVDVAQDVRVTEADCGTVNGIKKFATEGGELAFKINGRTATEDILHPNTGEVLVKADELISAEAAALIEKSEIKSVNVRSVLTCATEDGVCAKCYGHDLTTNMLVSVGEAVGIIAAQSIGEPGTQLTMRTFHTGGAVEEVSDARQRQIRAKASGTVRFRDFHPGITVHQEGTLWISTGPGNAPLGNPPSVSVDEEDGTQRKTGNRANLDAPTYKVTRVIHADCKLRKDELLNEKQYSENAQRYKGFETVPWQHRVTAVHDDACPVKEGDRLSAAQWREAISAYGFPRFATEKREITHVRLSTVNVQPDDVLTEEEIEQREAEIRNRFDGEWCYRIPKTGEIFKSAQDFLPGLGIPVEPLEDIEDTEMLGDTSTETAEDLASAETSLAKDTSFERVYRITERTHRDFPYAVGDIVAAEEIEPWLTPFEAAPNPVYVIDANAPWHAGETLTRYQYEEVCRDYRPFESEKAAEVLHHVTAVHHPKCPLKPGQDLTEADKNAMLARWSGFDVERLRHRVTHIYHPGFPHTPGYLMSDAEAKRLGSKHPGFETETSPVFAAQLVIWEDEEAESSDKAKPIKPYCVTGIHHRDCPLEAGDLFTPKEVTAQRRKFPGFDVERFYVIPRENIYEVTETKRAFTAKALAGSKKSWRITEVLHPACQLEVGKIVSDATYKKTRKTYPSTNQGQLITQTAFETWGGSLAATQVSPEPEKFLHRVTEAKPAFTAEASPEAETSRESDRTWRVTEVFNTACPYEVGQEISDVEYRRGQEEYGDTRGDFLTQMELEHRNALTTQPVLQLSETEFKVLRKTDPTLKDRVITSRYRVVDTYHPEFPFKVGEVLTDKDYKQCQKDFRGFDVEHFYEVTADEREFVESSPQEAETQLISDLTVEGPHYRHDVEPSPVATFEKPRLKKFWRVNAVSNPECPLEVGQNLSEGEYLAARETYKVITEKQNPDSRFLEGDILVLSEREYNALMKGHRQEAPHTVTAVHHPNCPLQVGDKLSKAEYEGLSAHYPGFDTDEPALRMHIEIETADGHRVPHLITEGYSFSVKEGDPVKVEDTLAELHEKTANMDIVAGIPRVTDLFEARRPKREDAAEIAEIEGRIEAAGTKAGVPTYRIVDEEHQSRLYAIPDEKRRVTEGDRVKAGQPLTDGYLNPHDILSIGRVFIEDVPIDGDEALWTYLVEEIQKVYGARAINDKHLEAIVRQMTRKVRVIAPGDTQFPHNSEVPRQKFNEVNAKVLAEDGKPATGEPILQGISRASLSTDSFISAASFQQTTKVLTDAAVKGQKDKLFGLKENVILGRLIPAGSGLSDFQHLEITEVDADEEMEAPESAESSSAVP